MKAKLGQEPAFAKSAFAQDGAVDSPQEGMSKRFFAACAAMKLPAELINVEFEDEDFIEDETGKYIKDEVTNSYFRTTSYKKNSTTYSIKTTPEYRLVRQLYRIADELLKQENE